MGEGAGGARAAASEVAVGFAAALAVLIVQSIVPDVVDAAERAEGARSDARHYAALHFVQKCGIGIALGLANTGLTRAGYVVGAAEQPPGVAAMLRQVFGVWVPVALALALGLAQLYRLQPAPLLPVVEMTTTNKALDDSDDEDEVSLDL
jgi:Na+/melibiose symporter-like transporter